MGNLLSSLLSGNKHEISPELRQKIKLADLPEIVFLCAALREYYNVDQNLVDELLPQAHQLELSLIHI